MATNSNDVKTLIEQLLVTEEVTVPGCEDSQIVADLPYVQRTPPTARV